MCKLRKLVFSAILIALSGFLISYTFYMWIGYYEINFLGFRPFSLDQVDLRFFYLMSGFVAFTLGLIIADEAFRTWVSEIAKGFLVGSVAVFGGYLIYDAYHVLIGHYLSIQFASEFDPLFQWRFIYFLLGFSMFTSGIILAHKALSTLMSIKTKGALSAILVATGSFLIYDFYNILAAYYQIKSTLSSTPASYYLYFMGLQLAYQWLPLYIVVALVSIASGSFIAYKTLKTSKIHPKKTHNNLSLVPHSQF